MKINNSVVLFVFLLCCVLEPSLAQKTYLKFLGVETGKIWYENEMLKMDYIRGDVPFYYTGRKSTSYANSSIFLVYAGIKPEFIFFKNKLGITAGLNYTRMKSSIMKGENGSNSNDYFFYFLYRQNGVNTEYLKIKEINQKSDYLGIPIEIRYFLFKPRPFRFYIKLGAEFSYCLQTKTNVDFLDKAMEIYKQGVIEKYDQPKAFNTLLNGAVGFRFRYGKDSKPEISVEIRILSVFLTSRPSSLADPKNGLGFQFEIQIPLKSKSK